MPTSEAIARYFLHLAANATEPSPLTQMQLHKLLYYAQGWTLATQNRPLFESQIQAWQHGPVVVDLYPLFKCYDDLTIPSTEAGVDSSIRGQDRGMIETVWLDYGRYSAWRLREMTHAERPWLEARGALKEGESGRTPITVEAMRSFFREQHEAACRKHGIDPAVLDAARADLRAGKYISWEELKAECRPLSRKTG